MHTFKLIVRVREAPNTCSCRTYRNSKSSEHKPWDRRIRQCADVYMSNSWTCSVGAAKSDTLTGVERVELSVNGSQAIHLPTGRLQAICDRLVEGKGGRNSASDCRVHQLVCECPSRCFLSPTRVGTSWTSERMVVSCKVWALIRTHTEAVRQV